MASKRISRREFLFMVELNNGTVEIWTTQILDPDHCCIFRSNG